MHTKKTDIPISSRNSINQRCGDCLHFKLSAKFEKPCSQLGIKSFGAAPPCFSPNVYTMAQKSPDLLYQVGLLFHNFTPSQSRVLLSLLNMNKIFTKSYKLKFGQPVFFRLGNDYLSNYFKGYVVGVATAGDQQVFVTSDLSGSQKLKPVIATLARNSVFSVTEFKKKREDLVASGRLQDPQPLKTKVKKPVDSKYEVPSMEKAPSEWFDTYGARLSSAKKLKKGKGGITFKVSVKGK